jgi:hypothetical protein
MSINDTTGEILVCHGETITIFTLNGEQLLEQSICDPQDDCIASCATYDGDGNEWLQANHIFTGHKRGIVHVWKFLIRDGSFRLEHVKTLIHTLPSPSNTNVQVSITCIMPLKQLLYTGDEMGKVVCYENS